MPHGERHRSERIGWLRAAVLGANDGIVSTASLAVAANPPAWLPWNCQAALPTPVPASG